MSDYKWTVKELREMLKDVPDEALVLATFTDQDGEQHDRPIYKSVTSADDKTHYFYLSNR